MIDKRKFSFRGKLIIAVFLLIWISLLCSSLEAATLTYYRYHIVRRGDSLWIISQQYGISIEEIKRKNDLRTDRIYPDQKLIIPITIRGVYHEVKPQETLWRICRAYGVSMEEIIYLNRISDPNYIMPGQKLFIPGATEIKEVEIPREIIAPKETEISPPVPEDIVKPPPSVNEAVRGKGFLIWPINGDITDYRRSSTGIDIFAPPGTRIVAPAKGVVYFSGWLRNYGRAIIIEHAELGLYTCYMHNSVNLVEKDDFVEQGQPIAIIGDTGIAERIMLYLEIRRATDGRPLDPLEYLPSSFN